MPPFCEQCQSYIQYSPCGTKGSCHCPGQPLAGLAPDSPTPAPVAERARVEEIQARCDAATAGPWHYRFVPAYSQDPAGDEQYVWAEHGEIADINWHIGWNEQAPNNGEFIAAAREDVPYLLSLLAARDVEHQQRLTLQQERIDWLLLQNTALLGSCNVKDDRIAEAEAELARLREDLDIARAEGIRWANAAEVEQGRREEAEGENHRLCAIACREACNCPFGSESDLAEADQMDPENHADDCAWRLLREAWDEDAAALAGRGERME